MNSASLQFIEPWNIIDGDLIDGNLTVSEKDFVSSSTNVFFFSKSIITVAPTK